MATSGITTDGGVHGMLNAEFAGHGELSRPS